MKKTFVFSIGLIVSMILTCCNAKTASNDSQDLQQLVLDYGEALNSLAASSLEFGADTETEWAIDTVNTIWNDCKTQPFDLLQYMARISVMQSYFAYGVDYIPLMLYWSKHYAETQASKETYKAFYDEDRQFVDSFSVYVREKPEFIEYFILNAYSLNMLDLYFAITDDLNSRDIQPQFASMYMFDYIKHLYKDKSINLTNYAWQLDGTSFYITYCTWIRRTSPNPNDSPFNNDLIEYAKVFDAYAEPIISAIENDTPLPTRTESDAQAYLLETLPMRIQMLKMLETNLKNIH